ncbi:response regulator transcription factor [Clostridium cochlearium]|uniref:response regulator transcription factor n=1 Tax=Clostridium cochlearium TaxID=1494 RepID=UPI001EDF63A3|nr:response regulator transcription factor [Clostridium cochlearium]MCG4580721.1 response regulator transcription factor [Clostridium cochlearium]
MQNKYKVYLVEDDENLNSVLYSYLINEGYEVKSFLKGMEALNHIDDNPHLWILDIMLPDIDGFQIIKGIKNKNENTPVIFISARDADIDKIVGLEMGSDDYLAKPFLPRELIIRVKKLLKRSYKEYNSNIIKINGYNLDLEKRVITLNNEIIELTSKEMDILILFINNIQKAFSREEILNTIWGEDYFGSDRVVDDLIRRLRKRLSNLDIETIYGFGYRMKELL